jgi:transcription termination/antitermination protein NusA
MRLFEQEVPEIYDGTVTIKGCAREAGERTKIAVQSRDRDVDSVGACVGMKGMRVQSIIRELRGEKIDIIEYSEEPVVFATHALSPAKVSRITVLDPAEKHMEVIVDDSQLSLAIGKKGQNVRLAAKLLGWKIDIKSEEEKRQEVESAMAALVAPGAPVSVLIEYGLAEKVVETLLDASVGTIERLGNMTPEQLEEIQGITPEMVEQIQDVVNAYYAQFEDSPSGESADASAQEPAQASSEPGTIAEETPIEEGAGEPLEAEAVAGEQPEGSVEINHLEADSIAEGHEELTAAEPGEAAASESAEQFGTIEIAGSPTHNQSEGAGPEGSESGAGSPGSGR